jgi:aerobic carbon-monoxide dehydrogenase medium subunit
MNDFEFYRPATLAEALVLMKGGGDVKLLAGGQSLIPILKLGLASPSSLVSLNAVVELHRVTTEGHAVVIGAATTHAEVAGSPDVKKGIPALAGLAGHIGDAQVRNRGTLGGSIAHSDPAADYPAALLGLGATVVTDRRQVAADDFFKGMFETALADDEIIVSVRFPVPKSAAYVKLPNPASRFAVVGVFVARTDAGTRVAVTGAASAPFRVKAFEAALDAKWAPGSLDGVPVPADDLVSDVHAGAAYRAHLVTVLAKRAVAACG